MGAKNASVVVDLGRRRRHQTGVAHRTEILRWVEAERRSIAQRAGGNSAPRSPKGLCGVFHEQQIVLLFESAKGVPISALAVEMNWQDCLDLCAVVVANDLLDSRSRKIEGCRIDIGEQRLRAATKNRADTCKEAERSSDNRIAGADIGGSQGEPDGVCPAGAADRMRHRAGSSSSLLEAGNLRPENESLRGADVLDGIEQFLPNTGKLTGKIKHLNGLRLVDRHVFMVYPSAVECSPTFVPGCV